MNGVNIYEWLTVVIPIFEAQIASSSKLDMDVTAYFRRDFNIHFGVWPGRPPIVVSCPLGAT